MKNLPLVILLILFSAFLPAKAKELIAVGAHFSRVFELNSEGECVGLGVDILTQLAHRNGDTIRFELYPWTRAQLMVEQGRSDILIGPYKNKERLALLSFFSLPFYQDEMVFYRSEGANIDWTGDFELLLGKRIAKVKNWAYGDEFMAQVTFLQVQDFTSLRGAVVRLGRGDLDLVASNIRNTEAFLQTMENPALVEPIRPNIATQNGYFAFARSADHEEIQADYEQLFNQMIVNGELRELGVKHGVTTP